VKSHARDPASRSHAIVLTGTGVAALATGTIVICADAEQAGQVQASGIDRAAIMVQSAPGQAAALIAAGWQVIVDSTGLPDRHAATAVAAIAAWLGAAGVSTRHPAQASRAIAMTESIRGTRPIPPGYVRD
jgi:hypothetical protein